MSSSIFCAYAGWKA